MPDVAFVHANRLPPVSERIGAMPVIPDLAVEIAPLSDLPPSGGGASPSDRVPKVLGKIRRYLDAGVPLV